MRESKHTAVFECRCDIRHLATTLKYLKSEGMEVRSKSELGRVIIELFKTLLVRNKKVNEFESSQEAHEYMIEQRLDVSSRCLPSLIKQINMEDMDIQATEDDEMEAIRKELGSYGSKK